MPSSTPRRVLLPDTAEFEMVELRKRLFRLETAMGRPMNPIASNVTLANCLVPPAGNFDGVTKYDIPMLIPCTFQLQAPQTIHLLASLSALLVAPGGGHFAWITIALAAVPWDPAHILAETDTRTRRMFDSAVPGYTNIKPRLSPEALSPPVVLGAGSYEARFRVLGEAGTQLHVFQGYIETFSPGG